MAEVDRRAGLLTVRWGYWSKNTGDFVGEHSYDALSYGDGPKQMIAHPAEDDRSVCSDVRLARPGRPRAPSRVCEPCARFAVPRERDNLLVSTTPRRVANQSSAITRWSVGRTANPSDGALAKLLKPGTAAQRTGVRILAVDRENVRDVAVHRCRRDHRRSARPALRRPLRPQNSIRPGAVSQQTP